MVKGGSVLRRVSSHSAKTVMLGAILLLASFAFDGSVESFEIGSCCKRETRPSRRRWSKDGSFYHPQRPCWAKTLRHGTFQSDDNENENNPLARVFDKKWFNKIGSLSSTTITDMVPSETPSYSFSRAPPLRQSLFSSPLVPLLYERLLPPVWAAGLRVGGMDEEYAKVAAFFSGNNGTGVVADISCGTGFIARRLQRDQSFRHVVALDYSTEMLEQCLVELEREKKNGSTSSSTSNKSAISVVRGDAENLPFRDESLDAIHWGAAMHCVPNAERAMNEMYQVLRPGGRLYATIFLKPLPGNISRFFTLAELEKIAKDAGFGSSGGGVVAVERLGPVYGVIRAQK